ncbi:putative sulfate exporter family transporter [Desemzia sp. RIT804]|uniref:YeiH family protein n=1 Tax=Desemzia sp. RIT 804 TaxID=2810209 RepID=UPI001950B21E|nr:putative sulfate exporter family transporter [Desemzia sp. RIT 804]MBM6614306.1 putative sulfate exporter family transporter [Desemzia sp. RIT 804]
MNKVKQYTAGILLTVALAIVSNRISTWIPNSIISGSVFALLLGMLLNPVIANYPIFKPGIQLVSKRILKLSIILLGLTLSFTQVINVGKYSLIVMAFTLVTAFGGGYLIGKLFNMNWKLTSLISAGTGICGGSAIAAIAPTIEAEDRDVAYSISATFIFDVLMVVLFPIAGVYFGMSDLGYGLWTGTAVNDTSSVVAAGYAFSDAAGSYAVIVKLTRTLSIVPVVLIFSVINARLKRKEQLANGETIVRKKVSIKNIFPFFILLFLVMVAIKTTGIVSESVSNSTSTVSKFLMVMALGSIGLKTNFYEVAKSGFKPMLHGFIISSLVVVISFIVQLFLGQI